MAKTRRIVKKAQFQPGRAVDERLWPVNVALAVLTAFVMGMVAVYRQPNDVWYRSSWFWLVAIPLISGGAMLGLRFLDNRTVRRAAQLATVLSLLVHILFLLWSIESTLFGVKATPETAARKPQDRRPKVVVPEYAQHHFNDPLERPQQDYEKPVETKTPDPPAPEVARQETQPEPPMPVEQPTPTPEPQTQPQQAPANVAKQQAAETAPRASEQAAKLSRNTTPSRELPNQTATIATPTPPVPAVSPRQEPSPTTQATARTPTQPAERSTNTPTPRSEPTPSPPTPSPPTPTPSPADTKVVRRSVDSPQPPATMPDPATAATVLPRQTSQPRNSPSSVVTAAAAPAPSRQTTPDAPQPATTAAVRQQTAAASAPRQPLETAPTDPTLTPTPTTNAARQSAAPPSPTLAATPTPVPNQRPRTTTRVEVATTAPIDTPQPTPLAAAATQPQPRNAPAPRAANATNLAAAAPSAAIEAPSMPTTANATPAPTMRREQANAPAANSPTAPAPTALARQAARAPANAVSTNANAAASPTATANTAVNPAATTPTAGTVATRKQDTASPQTARTAGEPTPSNSPTSPTPTAVANAVRAGSSEAPQPIANNPTAAAPTGRQAPNATPNVLTQAAAVATNMAPRAAAEVQAAADASQVARQNSPSTAATRVQNQLDAPSLSTSNQPTQASVSRAQAANAPSIDPTATAAAKPARAAQTSPTASSPTAVESPAMSIAAQGTGEPAAQPQTTAVARSTAGMAGAGQSANLDRSAPAAPSPALLAAGAAQRSQATQATPEGPALAPSEAAILRRSTAGADRPSAVLKAEPIPTATTAGAAQPTQLAASASASVTQASSNAAAGAVNAAAGRVEVDTGPTQVVSERGVGRASGGGQPDATLAPESAVIARSRTGGSPQMSIAATVESVAPAAPAATGGGSPPTASLAAQATATVRNQEGGAAPVTGGPSAAAAPGATVEVSAAPQVAEISRSRADAVAGAAAATSAGGQPNPSTNPSEERAPTLARAAAGGGPQLAAAASIAAEVPTTAMASSSSPAGATGAVGAAGAPAGAPAGTPAANAGLEATALSAAMGRPSPSGASPNVAAAGGVAGSPSITAGDTGSGAAAELVAQTVVARAEATDGTVGSPTLGGGAPMATRAVAGATLPSNSSAAELAAASQPSSSGSPTGLPLEAQGIAATKLAGGPAAAAASGPVGAMTADTASLGEPSGSVGAAAGKRQSAENVVDAVTNATPGESAGARRAESTAAGAIAAAATPVADVGAEVTQATDDHLVSAATRDVRKTETGGGPLAVDLAALEGPGGLGSTPTVDVGIQDRRASEETIIVQPRATRFLRQSVGGLTSVSTAAVLPTDSFKNRTTKNPGSGGLNGSPPPQTEEAIELGLSFLAKSQAQNGSWSLSGLGEEVLLSSDTAATALCLMAFQGAGYNHREHKYKDVVRAGLEHLLKNQRENGDLFVQMDDGSNASVWLYSHSIAALALCEAYGMTQDPELKIAAQKAVDFIVAGQNKTRGGWRYSPGVGSDTSVTGWMMMALKSGELAGLQVPRETFVGIQRWVESAQASTGERHLYRYNPLAPDTDSQRHGRAPSRTMTSVGLLMRLYLGWKRDNPEMIRGAEYLLQAPPALGTARNVERDTYYWYYATQVMFHVGGERWKRWNDKLHPLLVSSQVRTGPMAGSWDPNNPLPDRWAPHAGRLYVTTLNLLSLEVYYRHLPIYVETAK